MNANSKKAAVKKYSADEFKGLSKDEIIELLNTDEKGYSSEDVVEIVEALFPVGGTQNKKFVYPEYDLWKVDVQGNQPDKEGNSKTVNFTAIKVLRPAVKLEHSAAQLLNSQSHNSLRRYYESGSITNGNEEKNVHIK